MQQMPTKHPRIAVTKDAELAAALASVRAQLEGAAEARIVRNLAIDRAKALGTICETAWQSWVSPPCGVGTFIVDPSAWACSTTTPTTTR